MDFAKRRSEIDEYLPTYKKGKYPNRQFLCNLGKITCLMTILIVNSLLPHDFSSFYCWKNQRKGSKSDQEERAWNQGIAIVCESIQKHELYLL